MIEDCLKYILLYIISTIIFLIKVISNRYYIKSNYGIKDKSIMNNIKLTCH